MATELHHPVRAGVLLPLLAGAALLPALLIWLDEPFYLVLASRIMIYALAATSLNLLVGFGGMVSFGHAAYFGTGAYVVGIAATTTSQVGAPALEYVSPIGDYKAYEPQSIQSWKEANDNVGRIGGWRNYSRETSQSQPSPSAPAASGGSAPHTNHHGDKK